MKIIIVGCGRLGQGLFWQLRALHHQVVIIESDAQKVQTLQKQAPDAIFVRPFLAEATLLEAGVQTCDAVVACTPSDEVNAVLARVAKQQYRVPKVIARLYDPLQAGIYAAFGIQTLATTLWGVERAVELLTYSHLDSVYEMNHGEVKLVYVPIPSYWWGRKVRELTAQREIEVVTIQRENKAFIPDTETCFEVNDHAYLVVTATASQQLQVILGMKEELR